MEENQQLPTSKDSPVQESQPSPQFTSPLPSDPIPVSKKKPRFTLSVIAAIVLLLGGGGAALYVKTQNSPSNIWKTAMQRTGEGFDSIVERASEESEKGGKITGSLKIESPLVVDASINSQWYETNASVTGEVGFSGVRASFDIRSIAPEPNQTPDVYLNVSGLDGVDSLLDSVQPGLGSLVGEVNDTWYYIDRTLIDQALLSQSGTEDAPELTTEDVAEISEKSAAVLRDRIFTADETKAVVVVDEAVGKEDFEGSETYKYKVKVRKEQLKQFATELKNALSETKVKELALQTSPEGGTFEEAINFDGLIKIIEEADYSRATAEAWVDLDSKLIRNIRITSESNATEGETYVDFGLDYDGGDELPFTIKSVSKNTSNDSDGELQATITYNKETDVIKLAFEADGKESGTLIKLNGEFVIEPSNEPVSPEKPEGAKNIYELLGGLLGGITIPDNSNSEMFELNSLPLDDEEL